jgi:hypothetical protein
MTNVIHVAFTRKPMRRVLYPSVVPFELNRSTPETRMALALMSLGLIFTTTICAVMLGGWLARFVPEDDA